ncbi:MAG: twin-arginine translocase TatA/TatE family subunit [Phycisphaerae bacterium]|nr:twin-arginine translocase TatA/TatE family subunit [Phycisphaerae bacterium]
MATTLAFLQNIGVMEWVILLIIMLLLFGRRLPEVGKSLGKGIVEFKKGLKGVDDDIESASSPKPQWQQQQYQQQLPGGQPQTQPPMGQAQTVSRNDKVE